MLGGRGNDATDHARCEGWLPEEGGIEDEVSAANGKSPDLEDLPIPGFDFEFSAARRFGLAENDGIDGGGGAEFTCAEERGIDGEKVGLESFERGLEEIAIGEEDPGTRGREL